MQLKKAESLSVPSALDQPVNSDEYPSMMIGSLWKSDKAGRKGGTGRVSGLGAIIPPWPMEK